MSFTFTNPKRKKRVFCKKESPFPVPIATVSGRPASPHNWEHYTGQLVDGHVIISDRSDAKALYTMGFFGKGTLSRSQPEHGQIRPAQKRRHKPTESKTVERMLQVVSRRKYLCHMNWSHQGAVQRGESPPDQYVVSDDIDMSDDRMASVPQQHPVPFTPDTVGRTFLPCRQQTPRDEGPVGHTVGMGERLGNTEGEGGREDREDMDQWAEENKEKDPWASGDNAESLEFWGMAEPDKGDATVMSSVVTEDTDKAAESDDVTLSSAQTDVTLRTTHTDDVTLRTTQTDDVTLRTTQTDDVTLRTIQTDDVTLRTTQTDDVTLRTTQTADVTLRTTQTDDVTLRTTQTDDVTPPIRQSNRDVLKQDIPHSTESTTDPATVPSDDITEGQRSAVDPRSLDTEEDGDWFVVPDSWDSDHEVDQSTAQLPWQPVVKRDPFKLQECLQLSLVEAFFLSYGLGCLTVIDDKKGALSVAEMWVTFCKCQKNFLRDYVAYHNLRSKGWVPKTGLKYGAEFILYKDGPPFYHASYSVMVRLVTHDLQDDLENRPMTWTSLAGLNRMTEQVGKEVMLCYVIKPKDFSSTDLESPACLSRFTVQEVILRRWVSAQEREHVEGGDMP